MGMEPWVDHIMAFMYTPQSVQLVESNKFVDECRNTDIESGRPFGKAEWTV
jgi:hypothetical protein